MAVSQIISRKLSTTPIELIREILKRTGNTVDYVLLQKMKMIKCGNGECLAEMEIEKEDSNLMKGLHGGSAAKLIDTISSFAIVTHDRNFMMPSVSVAMNLSFLKLAPLGDEIIIDAKTMKIGKKLAYLKCEIKNKDTGDVLVEGTHVKSFLENAKPFTEILKMQE